MNVSEAIDRIADDTSVNTNVAGTSDRLLRHLNRVCSEKWDGYNWSFRNRNYRIVTDVDVTAGTVTLTNGSATVTGVGTSFTSSHIGWHIYFPGDSIQNWYKVRNFTSTTQIVLDVPYTGTSGSSKSYILRHFDYTLPTEPWDFSSVIVTHDRKKLDIFEPMSLDIMAPVPMYKGYPKAVAIYSSDVIGSTYSTGTVTGTTDSQILTGSGTTWSTNVYPGDTITISGYSYTIFNITSDTGMTLYNNLQTSPSGTAYSISRKYGRIMRIMWPSSDSYVLDIRASRKYAPLVNNNDSNELLYRYPNAVISAAAALEMKGQDDTRSQNLMLSSEALFARAQSEDEAGTLKEQIAPIFSYRSGAYRRRIVS